MPLSMNCLIKFYYRNYQEYRDKMTTYLKAWKTIDLDQQRSHYPTFKHLNEKKLSIQEEDL